MPEQDEAGNQPSYDSQTDALPVNPDPAPLEAEAIPAENPPAQAEPDSVAPPVEIETGTAPEQLSAVQDEASTTPDEAPAVGDEAGAEEQPVELEADVQLLIPAHATLPGGPSDVSAAEPESEPEPAEPLPPVKEPRRLSRADRETYDRQRRRFTACGRCGYFIADCQITLGEEALQDAILAATRDGWVRLEGDSTFHRLVMNAYGVPLESEFDSLDAACPECRRRYVLANLPDGPTRLKIHV